MAQLNDLLLGGCELRLRPAHRFSELLQLSRRRWWRIVLAESAIVKRRLQDHDGAYQIASRSGYGGTVVPSPSCVHSIATPASIVLLSAGVGLDLRRIVIRKIVSPGRLLMSCASPPCSDAIELTRVRPRPVPFCFPSLTNGSKSLSRMLSGTPGPSSITSRVISSSVILRIALA